MNYLHERLIRLRDVTEGCLEDMHEPDEQGIRAHIVGTHLDNAFGEHIDERLINTGSQEYVVIIERCPEQGHQMIERFNLATLIALARKAAL